MIPKTLDAITRDDLESLVRDAVSERRDLEFKRAQPGRAEAEVKEYLADVTSLANAHGGDLVFGVEEVDGVATALPGISATSPDDEILRLENIMRDGTEPRLIGVRSHWVRFSEGVGAIVQRVPASLASPHRIRFKNSGRFYIRGSRGKYEMDTYELRAAFTANEQLPGRFKTLHEAAVAGARGQDMPFLMKGPTAVASVAPLTFFREMRDLPVSPENALMCHRPRGGASVIKTLEGVLWYTPNSSGNTVSSYALMHRSGRVDAAWEIGGVREVSRGQHRKLASWRAFESGLRDVAGSTVAKLALFGIDGSWVVLATIFGVSNYQLDLNGTDLSQPAWRDGALLPNLIIDHVNDDSMAPMFRAFWLLFGVDRSERHTPGP